MNGSFHLLPATCPIVDKIGDSLQYNIAERIYLIIPGQYHFIIEEFYDTLTEAVCKLVDGAIEDIKESATYPFREALDDLARDFEGLEERSSQVISDLEDSLAWERSIVEELKDQLAEED